MSSPSDRIARLVAQVKPSEGAHETKACDKDPCGASVDELNWRGWGYADTALLVNGSEVDISGTRYHQVFEASRRLPKLIEWAEKNAGIDRYSTTPPQASHPPLHAPKINEAFVEATKDHCDSLKMDDKNRVAFGHGHSCQEIFRLRHGALETVPDAVIFPRNHEDVVAIMKAAVEADVCLIPRGGGTSVSGALETPHEETRMTVMVAMTKMNRIKWVDKVNMLACIEAGAVGVDLEQGLRAQGVCTGHEPDSNEFSTMGGWVATRASGMKKNVYGNIEDMVVNIKCVTPSGVIEKGCNVPRSSTGPDTVSMIIGSEGTLGIVTEVIVRIRPLPASRAYGSIVFPDFESGVRCVREVAAKRVYPASIRLMDNLQFQFGQALKPMPAHPFRQGLVDTAKKMYITKLRGFDVNKMVAATLLFEGSAAEVAAQQKAVYAIAAKHGGLQGGAENGLRGYVMTYLIAYIRDMVMQHGMVAESFETSVPWDKVIDVCRDVKQRIKDECRALGVIKDPFVCCRVTQSYDTGACLYFYFGFLYAGLKNPEEAFTQVENAARDEILRQGGSLSHHHGVGKHRKKWMEKAVSSVGVKMLRGLKKELDPKNILGCRNLDL